MLPQNARYRIGLSATPEHYLDTDRNARLKAYYGDVVFTYSLAQAIQDKVLTPYNYYPRVVELTHDEAAEFVELSDEIARRFAREGQRGKPSQGLTSLLMKRSRIVGSAANKLAALRETLGGRQPEIHTLFYCGDGRVDYYEGDDPDDADAEDPGISLRQIEAVSRVLDDLGWRVSRFTANESRNGSTSRLVAPRISSLAPAIRVNLFRGEAES
jgi:superfamily II DNA or RNA helicase